MQRDFQALERKLSRGESLEEAADMCGIPREEAHQWAMERLQNSASGDITLLKTANSALQTGFRVLEQIACGGPREPGANNADLEAAKELLRCAVNVRKSFGARSKEVAKQQGSIQLDIFDKGNWDLKDPE